MAKEVAARLASRAAVESAERAETAASSVAVAVSAELGATVDTLLSRPTVATEETEETVAMGPLVSHGQQRILSQSGRPGETAAQAVPGASRAHRPTRQVRHLRGPSTARAAPVGQAARVATDLPAPVVTPAATAELEVRMVRAQQVRRARTPTRRLGASVARRCPVARALPRCQSSEVRTSCSGGDRDSCAPTQAASEGTRARTLEERQRRWFAPRLGRRWQRRRQALAYVSRCSAL